MLETEALDVPLVQNEIFGPVLSFETFATEDEAIARANAAIFGLAAAIFTKDTRSCAPGRPRHRSRHGVDQRLANPQRRSKRAASSTAASDARGASRDGRVSGIENANPCGGARTSGRPRYREG
jgi:Aldehyde dehydrogenase family